MQLPPLTTATTHFGKKKRKVIGKGTRHSSLPQATAGPAYKTLQRQLLEASVATLGTLGVAAYTVPKVARLDAVQKLREKSEKIDATVRSPQLLVQKAGEAMDRWDARTVEAMQDPNPEPFTPDALPSDVLGAGGLAILTTAGLAVGGKALQVIGKRSARLKRSRPSAESVRQAKALTEKAAKSSLGITEAAGPSASGRRLDTTSSPDSLAGWHLGQGSYRVNASQASPTHRAPSAKGSQRVASMQDSAEPKERDDSVLQPPRLHQAGVWRWLMDRLEEWADKHGQDPPNDLPGHNPIFDTINRRERAVQRHDLIKRRKRERNEPVGRGRRRSPKPAIRVRNNRRRR